MRISDSDNRKLLILDGGLGTTLKDIFKQDVSGPLWSARVIDENPESIVDAHLAFMRTGADVILTATYQCAFDTFERAGYSRDDAARLMIKAVRLADEARTRFLKEHRSTSGQTQEIKVALSLGSFGATLPGAEEFSGMYPPPYGPALDPQLMAVHEAFNTFSDSQAEEEEASIEALKAFHLERLRVFLPVWDMIDCVSFETVPLRREVKAIRRAVNAFEESMGLKLWWIGTVWPDGLFPEKIRPGEHAPAWIVAEALLGAHEGEARPWGVGVNCTLVEHVPRILEALGNCTEAQRSGVWLVVYPNGGDTYHPPTQSWISNIDGKGERWARRLLESVQSSLEGDRWGGMLVGGCCRTGPGEIEALVHLAKTCRGCL